MPTPEGLLADRLAADPASPLVTYYDRDSGERAELSAASLANWVTKTYFLLLDEVAVEPRDLAVVRLPVHWLRYVVLLGAWAAGLCVTDDVAAPAAVAFGHDPAELAAARGEVFALALAPWGRGYPGEPPAGTADFVAAVRPQPDAFASVRQRAAGSDEALPGLGRAALCAAAADRAAGLALPGRGRLLIRDDGPAPLDPVTWLAPLAVGGSAVLVAGGTDEAVESIAGTERVDAVA